MDVEQGRAAVGDDEAALAAVDLAQVDGQRLGGGKVGEAGDDPPQPAEQGVDRVGPDVGERGVRAHPLRLEMRLEVAVVGEAGDEPGRLADHDQRRAQLLEQLGRAVAVLLLADDQREADPAARRDAGRGERGERLDHRRAAGLHVGRAEAVQHVPLAPRAELLVGEERNRVHVADEEQLRGARAEFDDQVGAVVVRAVGGRGLAAARQAGGEERLLEQVGRRPLGVRGAVAADHVDQQPLQTGRVDRGEGARDGAVPRHLSRPRPGR